MDPALLDNLSTAKATNRLPISYFSSDVQLVDAAKKVERKRKAAAFDEKNEMDELCSKIEKTLKRRKLY